MLYLLSSANDASPKAISARTSYLQVRLAFHPYPHLIRALCNVQRFDPPRNFTPASVWTWIAHLVSGLLPATYSPYSDSLSLRLRLSHLNLATDRNSLAHSPIGTPSPGQGKPRHQALTACKHTVSGSLSLPYQGSFSPFPHGTCPLSVAKGI